MGANAHVSEEVVMAFILPSPAYFASFCNRPIWAYPTSTMRLSQKAIDEFKIIHFQEFGESLSNGEAREMAERFINVMEIICRPIPGVDFPIDEDKNSLAKTLPGTF